MLKIDELDEYLSLVREIYYPSPRHYGTGGTGGVYVENPSNEQEYNKNAIARTQLMIVAGVPIGQLRAKADEVRKQRMELLNARTKQTEEKEKVAKLFKNDEKKDTDNKKKGWW